MRRNCVHPFAILLLLSAGPAWAGAIWSISAGKEDGFDVTGNIEYKIFCQNGEIVSGSSGMQPGAAGCADGSNSITWSWGLTSGPGLPVPWCSVEQHDRKGDPFRKHLRDSLQTLFDQGKLIVFGRVILPQGNNYAERAVLAVPQAVVRPFVGKTVDNLLAEHVINPSQVLFHRRYASPTADLDATETDTIPAPGIVNPNQICLYDYVNSSHAAPGASPGMLGVLLGALAVLGGAVAWRRRRAAKTQRA
jgi:MYXO-CTERM domain-containing protein